MKPEATTIVFDVNETLSNMDSMDKQFAAVGAPEHLAKLWFATLLRDGFALTVSGQNPSFTAIGSGVLRDLLTGVDLNLALEPAIERIMTGLGNLELHPDVSAGVRALSAAGFQLATLSNGSSEIAKRLLGEAGIRDHFKMVLSVQDAPAWKPDPAAYRYAAQAHGINPANLLLVAVHPWDIHGAACAGLRTAWLNRSKVDYPDHFDAPDFTVSNLAELLVALR